MASNLEPHGYLRKVLSPGETVLFSVRQHGIFLFWRMFLWMVLAVVIVVGATAFGVSTDRHEVALIPMALIVIPLSVIWWQYLVWSNHGYVLTNRRVIQMHGVFGKEVIDSLLEKLNDIKTDQSLLGRILNYGDVEILTANEDANNVFKNIARPLEFKTTMLNAKQNLDSVAKQ